MCDLTVTDALELLTRNDFPALNDVDILTVTGC